MGNNKALCGGDQFFSLLSNDSPCRKKCVSHLPKIQEGFEIFPFDIVNNKTQRWPYCSLLVNFTSHQKIILQLVVSQGNKWKRGHDDSPIQKFFPNWFHTILNMHLLFPPVVNGIHASNSSALPVSTCFTISPRRGRIDFPYSSFLVWVCDLLWQQNKPEVTMCSLQIRTQKALYSSVHGIMRKASLSQLPFPRRKKREVGRATPVELPTRPSPEQNC